MENARGADFVRVYLYSIISNVQGSSDETKQEILFIASGPLERETLGWPSLLPLTNRSSPSTLLSSIYQL